MRKSFRNLLIISLSAAMIAGQAVTAFADDPGADTTNKAGVIYSGRTSSGSTSSLGPGNSGPGVSAPIPNPAVTNSVPEPSVLSLEQIYGGGIPADVRQGITSHHLTMALMRSDPGWSETVYINANAGAGVASPQGILSMVMYSEPLPGDVLYRTYSSATGWSRWVMNGEHAPYTVGVLVEAVQIRLAGVANDYYDVSYSTTLSNGSSCGWSYNGATNGTMGTGAYITGLEVWLTSKGAYDTNGTGRQVMSATSYDGIRFNGGLPTYVSGTGDPFTGWAWNGNDRYYFVENNAVTGWQYIDGFKYYFNEGGKLATDLEPIIGANGPYLIRVNKEENCATIYVRDGDNGFIIPLKSFLCSTGEDTPLGMFTVPEKFRWHEMIHEVYCQYLLRLGAGLRILLHSAIYDSPNVNTLSPSTYNAMGIARSAGCIRFVTRDAKWMYDHCPVGTSIEVYNSAIPGPYERPCVDYYISSSQTWDPTDPEAIALYGTVLTVN